MGDLFQGVRDSHLLQTLSQKSTYAGKESGDLIISLVQLQSIQSDLLPRSIICSIAHDEYVSFNKLHATLQPGYGDFNDEPQDFGSGFVIQKKDHSNAKLPVLDETTWTRCFDSWSETVVIVFPHQREELQLYQSYIKEKFRVTLHPLLAIRLDAEIWDRYSRNNFHLDDSSRLDQFFMAEVAKATISSADLVQVWDPQLVLNNFVITGIMGIARSLARTIRSTSVMFVAALIVPQNPKCAELL